MRLLRLRVFMLGSQIQDEKVERFRVAWLADKGAAEVPPGRDGVLKDRCRLATHEESSMGTGFTLEDTIDE